MQSTRLLATCACAIAGAFAAAAPADAKQPPPAAESFFLDTYEDPSDGMAGPVSTAGALAAGRYHFVTVEGTYAVYNRWLPQFLPCGAPEPNPVFPSPGAPAPGNSIVGLDAEFEFARQLDTATGADCATASPGLLPRGHWSQFQIDTGGGFRHVEPVGGRPAAPRADHTYTYAVQGTGAKASFGLVDDPTTDNYGRLRITVRPADGEDCKKGGWATFGSFKNQGDCVSTFARMK